MQATQKNFITKLDFSFVKSLDPVSSKTVEKSMNQIHNLSSNCFNSDFFHRQFRIPLFNSLCKSFEENTKHYTRNNMFYFDSKPRMIQQVFYIIENKIENIFSEFKKFEGIVSVDLPELRDVIEKNKDLSFIKNTVNKGDVTIKFQKTENGNFYNFCI